MSLIGAFIAGVTGVDAQSTKFSAISDNISNANTVGYKPTEVGFKTLVTRGDAPTVFGATGPVPRGFYPGGVAPSVASRMDLQGILQSSSSSTDLGIVGRGFFPVATAVDTTAGTVSGNVAVTRAGSFQMDKDGFLVNSAGFTLLGVTAGTAMPTDLTGLVPVKFDPGPGVSLGGTATSTVTAAGNLPASSAINSTNTTSIGVFDSSGNAYSLGITYTKTALNTWSIAATSLTNADGTTAGTVSSTPITVSFNADGTLASGGTGSLGTFTTTSGTSISPSFDFSAFTQYGDSFAQAGLQQDGGGAAFRTGFQVDEQGFVSEVYSNGKVIPKFQIPVVNYINPQGLEAISGDAWLQTSTSGTPAINVSNTDGSGQITPSTLEQSSVDLADQFTQMIASQATYNANTKTITVADEMYQTIVQLR